MNHQNLPMNQNVINNHNYNEQRYLKLMDNINDNLMNYKNNLEINKEQNFQTIKYNNMNPNIFPPNQQFEEQNEIKKLQYTINNYQKIIKDLQYSNSFLNQKNLSLESALEFIKNKYNSTKNDLVDINKHITICKENQDKIISNLIKRNNYLENMISKKDSLKNNNENINKEEILDNKNNNKLNYFIFKIKQLFKDDNNNEKNQSIKDEDYLNNIINNIIKIKNELNKYKKELEIKSIELNKLKNENQELKLKFRQINLNNAEFTKISNNNSNIYSSSTNYSRTKTPIGPRNLSGLSKNNNSNFEYKDNYSYNKNKIPIFMNKFNSHSPSPLRNNLINNLSKLKKNRELDAQTFNTEKMNENLNNEMIKNNISFNKRKNKILENEKKLISSHSLSSIKFKTINDSENDKNNNTFSSPKQYLVNQQCENSRNCLKSLMNNIAQLEYALKDSQNNIYVNDLPNINQL